MNLQSQSGNEPDRESLTLRVGDIRFSWRLILKLVVIFSVIPLAAVSGQSPGKSVLKFVDNHCLDCHDDAVTKGGLDLLELSFELDTPEIRERWVLIHDRVKKGEMPPPKKAGDLSEDERKSLVATLNQSLLEADYAEIIANNRGPLRRLTRGEYENNLRDLLKLPNLDVADRLPAERNSHGFTTYEFTRIAKTLDMSRVQMEAYLGAAETALRAALADGVEPNEPVPYRAVGTNLFSSLTTYGGREAMFFAKKGKMVVISAKAYKEIRKSGEQDPELELALFRSATWPYFGYPRGFKAKSKGTYRVRFSARAVRQMHDFRIAPAHVPLPMTFRARQPSGPDASGDIREVGGWMDILPEAGIFETTVRLKAGETIEYSLLGLPVPHPIAKNDGPLYYDFPPMPAGGHPGVAIKWIEVKGPVSPKEWPSESHRVLLGQLPIQAAGAGSDLPVDVSSKTPKADAARLFRSFANKAARRPVPEADQAIFLTLIFDKLDEGAPFAEAMLKGYQAFLCSGHFLYLLEPVGDDVNTQFSIASRLSHFLWNSRPDDALEQKAVEGKLRDPEVLRAEIKRLIEDDRFDRFVTNFTNEWLDLREMRRDIPDIRLYPEYRKDDYLVDSLEKETRAFFAAMVRENLPATVLVDSDFTFVNDRLARHYDLAPVRGAAMRRVKLPDQSPYGGLLTQGAVLKITANGASTSPVLRGVWVVEKLIGNRLPPPPKTVPDFEPDVRGAATIRQLLAKHTESESCVICHARFDPLGFALENFDIMGAWRDRYREAEKGEKITGIDRAGHAYEYRVAEPVDSSAKLLSGESFDDILGLKAILTSKPRQLARNLLNQFTTYATGTPVRFSDRVQIEAMLDQCEPDGYRVGDLLRALVVSEIFIGSHPVEGTGLGQ